MKDSNSYDVVHVSMHSHVLYEVVSRTVTQLQVALGQALLFLLIQLW